MNDDRTFERAARSWIEQGPTRAPERAVEVALLRIESTTQERGPWIPWRVPRMTTTTRVVAIAAIGVLILAGLGLLGVGRPSLLPAPAPTTVPTASTATVAVSPAPSDGRLVPASLTTGFTSPLHGYSIRLPAGSLTKAATRPWSGVEGPDPAAAYMDVLRGTHYRLVVASASLAGQASDEWKAAYVQRFGMDGVGVCDVPPKDWPLLRVGDHVGYLDGNDCPGDQTVSATDVFYEALAFVDGRVYTFWLQGDVNRADFDALLATVTFIAPPGPSASPVRGAGPHGG